MWKNVYVIFILHGKMGQSAPPPYLWGKAPRGALPRGHIIATYTYISVHTTGSALMLLALGVGRGCGFFGGGVGGGGGGL